MKTVFLAVLTVLVPVAAQAADYPVTFGEINGEAVTATNVLKSCESSTGYKYGFRIVLPAGEKHRVRIKFMTPPIPGQDCVSCRSFSDEFGDHGGTFVQSLEIGSAPGMYSLKIYVDDWKLVHEVDYRVAPSKSCP